MNIFDAFSPEAIFTALARRMGVEPEKVQALVNEFATEIATIRQEREAFRIGAAKVVQHFNSELAAVREQLGRIERALGPRIVTMEQSANGKRNDEPERNDEAGCDDGSGQSGDGIAGRRSGTA